MPPHSKTVSREFKAALIGLAMTVIARIGPWYWPGWPARTVLDFVLARWAPSQVSGPVKGLGLLALIIVNAGFWGVIAWTLLYAWSRRQRV